MSHQDAVSFDWAVGESNLEALRRDLLDAGAELHQTAYPFQPPAELAEEYRHPAFEPMLVLAGALAVGFLADRVIRCLKLLKRGGLIIDARQDKLVIMENTTLEPGVAVVIGRDGTQMFDSSKPVELAKAFQNRTPED